jgi:PRTRC genetic system protein A
MIDHIYPTENTDWDAPIKGFYQVVHASNGEFIRAKRDGLEVTIRVSDAVEPACSSIPEMVRVEKKIEAEALGRLYGDFVRHLPNERLVWITKDLMMLAPRQRASPGKVKAVDPYHPALANVLFDVHSHNTMEAYFSSQDDKDESRGFRVYIVIGMVGSPRPQIKARVGAFGHFMNVPIEMVAILPESIKFEDRYESN